MGRQPRRRGRDTGLRTSKLLNPLDELNASAERSPGKNGSHDVFDASRGKASCASRNSRKKSFRRLANQEEGVLYTVKINQDIHTKPPSKLRRLKDKLLGRGNGGDAAPAIARTDSAEEEKGNGEGGAPPQSPSGRRLRTQRTTIQPQQYTVAKLRKRDDWKSWLFCREYVVDAESYLYKPSKPLARYINWTFYASFTSVFMSFLFCFIVLCLVFAGLYVACGEANPECIIVSSEHFGTNPNTKFGDAFALSWTTFTTVGYGNVYTATGTDYVEVETEHCSGVVFLCTLQAFMGLLYAGMCAAILFGKVNRVQSHAHLIFANAVCLQYEDVELDCYVDGDTSDSDCDSDDDFMREDYEVRADDSDTSRPSRGLARQFSTRNFRDQFQGCPVIKFQVVNLLCNKGGGEIIDGLMKVVGIKLKRYEGRASHSQYVRVNLVDFEHPFFARVWHGVHVLDATSPLLTDSAKKRIKENGGRWPERWLERPEQIRRKLDFQSLVVTVSGVSNVSACTVHAYKRYKAEDVIIGFDFAPLVYENESQGRLEVDLDLANDVREQHKGGGEDLKASTAVAESHKSIHVGPEDYSRGTSTIFKSTAFASLHSGGSGSRQTS